MMDWSSPPTNGPSMPKFGLDWVSWALHVIFLGPKATVPYFPCVRESEKISDNTIFPAALEVFFNASRSEEDLRNFEAYSLQQMLSNVGNQSVWSIIVNYKMADS